MKTENVLIAFVAIILIVIVIIVVAYFAYKQIFMPKPINPIPAGDVINFSFLINNNDTINYFQLMTSNSCNYGSVNITDQYNSQNTLLRVIHNSSDVNKFALRTNSGNYLYLTTDSNFTDYISWDATNAKVTNTNIWFSLRDAGNRNFYLQTDDGRALGFLQNPNSCYSGVQVNGQNLILAVNTTNPQMFYLTDFNNPIRPANVNYPFSDGNKVTINSSNINLVSECASITDARFSSAKTNNQWTVKFSSDKLAFALMSVNGNYLRPNINSGQISFSANFSTLSNYDQGDYTNWFILSNGILVSLLTNASIYYYLNSTENCQGSVYYETIGNFITNGQSIIFTKV